MAKEYPFDAIASAVSQMYEPQRRLLESINFDAIDTMKNAVKAATINSQYDTLRHNLLDSITQNDAFYKLSDEIAETLNTRYLSANLFQGIEGTAFDLAKMQASMAIASQLSKQTQMISDITATFAQCNFQGVVQAIQSAISVKTIAMPDISYLKISPILDQVRSELQPPIGLLTTIQELNKSCAIRIQSEPNLVYDTEKRKFVDLENSNSKANVVELNSISGFQSITDNESEEVFSACELMDFMSYLFDTPMLALDNPVGQKILNFIQSLRNVIDFDKDHYFHSRVRSKDTAPYVWDEMKKAPYGIPFPGRYNHEGQAHFYFAETQNGAINEVAKHMTKIDKEEKEIQTIMIRPNRSVKLLDLSSKSMRGYNTFLKYIRMDRNDSENERFPRVYLIPCFVAECCKMCGLDGIKYYGGKDYSNYVTWSDGYFQFERSV